MATTMVISCPECKKQIKGTADLQGKRIKCKACGHIFVVKAAGAKTNPAPQAAPAAQSSSALRPEPEPPKPAPIPDIDDDRNPYRMTAVDLAPRCPLCAYEMESETAVICLNCGYNTQTRTRHETKRTFGTTSADYFHWWLPGILAVVFILVLIGLDVFYVVFFPGMVRDDFLQMLAHPGLRTWAVIISLFMMFFAGMFAVKRLILNPNPPEKEKD